VAVFKLAQGQDSGFSASRVQGSSVANAISHSAPKPPAAPRKLANPPARPTAALTHDGADKAGSDDWESF